MHTILAEFRSEEELVEERKIFRYLDYKYFRENYGLPDLSRQTDEQIKALRTFLNVATLTVLRKKDMAVSFRNSTEELSEASIVKANTMVQIATNRALQIEAPKYNKKRFEDAVKYALTLTKNHKEFYPLIRAAFWKSGVIFVILPNIAGSKTNGATKKLGDNIMLMVNDRRLYADSFWFTLFHEIGHIINGDYGISFEKETGEREEAANRFAEDSLIPNGLYQDFLKKEQFDLQSIKKFADKIDRDPGIVLGRLQNDRIVAFDDWKMKPLRHKYKVCTS